MPKGKGYSGKPGGMSRDAARSTQPTNPMQKSAKNFGQHSMIKVPEMKSAGHVGRKR